MKQPIAGVMPSETAETTIMSVWPSIAVYESAQFLGRWFEIHWPNIYIFRLGNLLAFLSIPYAAVLYFCRVAPRIGIRYRLTNRRLVVERGWTGVEASSIELAQFDEIKVVVRPGQGWYRAGDLSFCRDGSEILRLGGVSWPEGFRQTCWKTHLAHCGVAEVRRQQQPQSVA